MRSRAIRIILRHDRAEQNVLHVDETVADSNDDGSLLVIATTPQPAVTELSLTLSTSEEEAD